MTQPEKKSADESKDSFPIGSSDSAANEFDPNSETVSHDTNSSNSDLSNVEDSNFEDSLAPVTPVVAPPVLIDPNMLVDDSVVSYQVPSSAEPMEHALLDTVPVGDVELFRMNQAANGGAINSVILGTFTIVGAFLTPWSLLNGCLGIFMGMWGLTSIKKKTAGLGILLCFVGLVLCFFPITEAISQAIEANFKDSQLDVDAGKSTGF